MTIGVLENATAMEVESATSRFCVAHIRGAKKGFDLFSKPKNPL